jgi:serine/threonine protein kinase
MVKGLQHVQDTRGMVHLDVKAPNFLVDGNGVLKLSDFGTATAGKVRQMRGSPITNPRWASPELIKGNDEFEKSVDRATTKAKSAKKAALARVDKSLTPDQRKIAREDITQRHNAKIERLEAAVPGFSLTGKTDTWSLGIDAYRLFFKDFPFDDSFMAEIEKGITAFASNPNNRIQLPDMSQLGLSGQQQQDLQDLIQGMMHPDPTKRPSLDDVLADPLFQMQGVGGPQARALIQQLTS